MYKRQVLRLTTSTTGVSIGGSLTVPGNVSIGGTLTYEDVTNIDSVGIVTARNGLKVTGGTSNFSGTSHFVGVANFNETIVGTARTAIKLTCTDESTDTTTYPLFVSATTGDQFPKTGTNLSFNSANGTLSATTFSGSGASLTNLNGSNIASGTVPVARIGTGTKNTSTFYRGDGTFATVTPPAITAINSASNNRIVTSDGGTTVTAESGFTFDGSSVVIEAGNSAIKTKSTSNGNQTVVMSSGTARADQISITNSSIAGLFWHNGDQYSIHKTAGAWSGNYQQLKIDWPTGILIDGGVDYGCLLYTSPSPRD